MAIGLHAPLELSQAGVGSYRRFEKRLANAYNQQMLSSEYFSLIHGLTACLSSSIAGYQALLAAGYFQPLLPLLLQLMFA